MTRADALSSAKGFGWRVARRHGAHLRRADCGPSLRTQSVRRHLRAWALGWVDRLHGERWPPNWQPGRWMPTNAGKHVLCWFVIGRSSVHVRSPAPASRLSIL